MNKQDLTFIYANDYRDVRDDCHAIKENASVIARKYAPQIAASPPDRCLLVPIPGHEGKASHTLLLGAAICAEAFKNGKRSVMVLDCLVCRPHLSLCKLKHEGEDVSGVELGMRFYSKGLRTMFRRFVRNKYTIVLLDNVVDTGKTVSDAMAVVGECPVVCIGLVDKDK